MSARCDTIEFDCVKGRYRVAVDGFGGDTGAFTLTATCPSSTAPTEILCGVPTLGTTDGRADSVLVRGGVSQGADVSFIFDAAVTGDYTFSTCIGTSYNTLIEVFDLDTAKSVGFNDDSCGTNAGPSSVTINSLNAVSCQ